MKRRLGLAKSPNTSNQQKTCPCYIKQLTIFHTRHFSSRNEKLIFPYRFSRGHEEGSWKRGVSTGWTRARAPRSSSRAIPQRRLRMFVLTPRLSWLRLCSGPKLCAVAPSNSTFVWILAIEQIAAAHDAGARMLRADVTRRLLRATPGGGRCSVAIKRRRVAFPRWN